jgi:hypothetical protein
MAYTTIDNPELYFQVKTYTGTGSSQSITFDGSENMSPNFVWIKCRDATKDHMIFDTVRGVQKSLRANGNNLEDTGTDFLSSFDSDGFTAGGNGKTNGGSSTYVAWNWVESATAGFDIVTATGNATAKTISHSLSAVPHWMIAKEKTGSVNDWTVYHHKNTSAPETDSLILNEANATSDQNTHWNDTAPTSSVFTVGTGSVVNRNSSTYVYYLWSEKKGFSKFGSYTGNGNADGTFVYTGFKPAWVMIKRTDGSADWVIQDNKRDGFNYNNHRLFANTNATEESTVRMDFVSNGFKCRDNDGNGNGMNFIYMAFAEQPFVNSNGVPNNAR